MTNSWQIARQRPARKAKKIRVYVSLNRRGEIVLNEAAWKLIGDPASVALFYDSSTRRIGVKYPVALDRHFFMMRRYGRGRRNRIVRAARLLKQFEITVERTIVFEHVQAVNYNGEPMLILDLNQTHLARQNHDKATFAATA